MFSVMEPGPRRGPKGLRPALVMKLKPGWRYSEHDNLFMSPEGKKVHIPSGLPRGTRIDYRAPGVAQGKRENLSGKEKDLARFMHVVLPRGKNASDYLSKVQAWPFVEKAYPAPEVSLP